jgi:hypothetical protein
MSKVIAGIGSRKTPSFILGEMISVGAWARNNHIYVRSGHADGADWAFESGADNYCIAYLPWKGFNSKLFGSRAHVYILEDPIPQSVLSLVEKYHPAASRLSRGAKRLMARNCYQVLGASLKDPVSAVVCWCEETEYTLTGKTLYAGGTGFACRIARDLDIPILNMYRKEYSTADLIKNKLSELLEV